MNIYDIFSGDGRFPDKIDVLLTEYQADNLDTVSQQVVDDPEMMDIFLIDNPVRLIYKFFSNLTCNPDLFPLFYYSIHNVDVFMKILHKIPKDTLEELIASPLMDQSLFDLIYYDTSYKEMLTRAANENGYTLPTEHHFVNVTPLEYDGLDLETKKFLSKRSTLNKLSKRYGLNPVLSLNQLIEEYYQIADLEERAAYDIRHNRPVSYVNDELLRYAIERNSTISLATMIELTDKNTIYELVHEAINKKDLLMILLQKVDVNELLPNLNSDDARIVSIISNYNLQRFMYFVLVDDYVTASKFARESVKNITPEEINLNLSLTPKELPYWWNIEDFSSIAYIASIGNEIARDILKVWLSEYTEL